MITPTGAMSQSPSGTRRRDNPFAMRVTRDRFGAAFGGKLPLIS